MGVSGYSFRSLGVLSNSGFYVSRRVVVLTVMMMSALLLAVVVLSSVYARCSHTPQLASEKSWSVTEAAPAVQPVAYKQEAAEEKKADQTSAPETRPSTTRPSWIRDHQRLSTAGPRNHTVRSTSRPQHSLSLSTSGPQNHTVLSTSGSRDHLSLPTSRPLDHTILSTTGPRDPPSLPTSGPLDHTTLSTSGLRDHTNQSTSGPPVYTGRSTSAPQLQPLSEPWKHPRLPSALVPLHYDLELWIHLRPDQIGQSSKTFSGRLNITVQCVSPTARVLLHSLRLDYKRVTVLGPLPEGPRPDPEQRPVGRVAVSNMWKFPEMEYLVMELRETLEPGRRYALQFDYSGSVNQTHRRGLFSNVYSDQTRIKAVIASDLEPSFARAIYPCFDEPAMKATFNFTIIHHPTYVALSNMPALVISEREDANGNKWIVTSFATTPRMSTYVTAFAVCDYSYVNGTERGKEVRIWARKDAIAEGGADFALSITGPIFSRLEDFFNVSYPLPKIDLIGFPVFNEQAMENWGLITFDDLMLVQTKDDYPERIINIFSTVAHEIAHQWFGNLVTIKWWNDIWLNEGFATYFEYYLTTIFDPQLLKFQNEFFYQSFMSVVYREDHAMMYRTISTKVKNYTKTSEISDLFDVYIYQKGSCIIRMISDFLGENLFFRGLQSYLKTFALSNTEQDDLWTHFQMVLDNQSEMLLPASVKSILDKWTRQPGFPVITLNVSTGLVNQEPFFLVDDKNKKTFIHNNTWTVPIRWMKSGIVQPLVWIDNRSQVFLEMKLSDSEHDWAILNLNATGYYMVNYDPLGWKKISVILEKDPKAIPITDRVKLFDDAFALAQHGYIEFETALDLTKYLAKEEEVIVWNAVFLNLLPSDLFFNMNNHNIYSLFKKYLLKRLTPMWHIYSTKIRENTLQDDRIAILSLRPVFKTACWLGLEDCLQLSREMFSKWMNHLETIKNSNLIQFEVMCFGVAMGSDREWDFLLSAYNRSELDAQKHGIIKAMSCSRVPWILYRYMEYSLHENLFGSMSSEIIKNVASTEIGRLVAKDFLINNGQAVMKRFGKDYLLKLAGIIARPIYTDSQFQELQRFFGNMLGEEDRPRLRDKLEEKMMNNLQNNKKIAQIANWLKKNMAD
ncbi:aminopeptidase Q-like [Macrotis lagotis]|uniref:aminopeptidase Q-like n=1 Tax=Macrotis lagotis TaxID=92651 RepID=UPI003D6952C4